MSQRQWLCATAGGRESAPQPFCAADVTLRTAPELLREEVRAFAKSEPATRCDAAQKVMAPLREKIRAAYEQGSTSILTPAEVAAARNYVAACLTPTLLSNAGRLTEIEQTYLRRVTGLIVERQPAMGRPSPDLHGRRDRTVHHHRP